jgi:release factor glutamine methyltransferase
MPVSPPLTRDALVRRLRAAGCVFAEDEARLILSAGRTADALAELVQRRVAGEPLEHVLGWVAFCGLRVGVDPGVFVPRRRTELLVHEATALARPRPVVLDLCCGSGAVGMALGAALDGAQVYACDIEPAAVACARRNLAPARGQVFEGDLFEALPTELRGRVDLLAANVPYVPTRAVATMPPEARDFEPLVALDGGEDGLAVMRRVSAAAPSWLAPRGHLLVETSERQAESAVRILADARLTPRVVRSNDLDATVVVGTRR